MPHDELKACPWERYHLHGVSTATAASFLAKNTRLSIHSWRVMDKDWAAQVTCDCGAGGPVAHGDDEEAAKSAACAAWNSWGEKKEATNAKT